MSRTYFDATAPEQAKRDEIARLEGSLRTTRAWAYEQGNPPEARATVAAINGEIQQRQQEIREHAQYRDDIGDGSTNTFAFVGALIIVMLGLLLLLAWW